MCVSPKSPERKYTKKKGKTKEELKSKLVVYFNSTDYTECEPKQTIGGKKKESQA